MKRTIGRSFGENRLTYAGMTVDDFTIFTDSIAIRESHMKRKLFIAFTLIIVFTFAESAWAESANGHHNGNEGRTVLNSGEPEVGAGAAAASYGRRRHARRHRRRAARRRGRR